jgi:hypothetical protein
MARETEGAARTRSSLRLLLPRRANELANLGRIALRVTAYSTVITRKSANPRRLDHEDVKPIG